MLSEENQDIRKTPNIQEGYFDALATMQADYARMVNSLASSEQELSRVYKMWGDTTEENAQLKHTISSLQTDIKDALRSDYDVNVTKDSYVLQEKLNARHEEIALLTKMLRFSQHQLESERKKYEWMRCIAMLLLKIPKWWSFLPKREQEKKKNRRLLESGLFDSEYYVSRYPDVATSGIDPIKHYIFHGIEESRSKQP